MERTEGTEDSRTQHAAVDRVLRTSLAENTRRAYGKGWRRFADYCRGEGLEPMAATPDDVAAFLVRMASEPRLRTAATGNNEPLSLGTINVLRAAINRTFRDRGRPSPADSPTVTGVLRGLGRTHGRPPRQVKALREGQILAMLSCCDELARDEKVRTRAVRDAAVIAVGFAGALRRSEICGLDLQDLEFVDGAGMVVHIRRSKTDQLGAGQRVAILTGRLIRPERRVREWLELTGVARGPLFQSLRRGGALRGRALDPSGVADVVKRYAQAIGLEESEYSGHSLRAGFVTSAAVHGARLDKIMEVTRHTRPGTVLRYIRQENLFEDHAGAAFL